MTLEELIEGLASMDQNIVVEDGFSSPHSDRGDYSELAFTPENTAKISDMLAHAKSALGSTYEGWKGGHFTMHKYTPVHIGEYGTCGEEITSSHFKLWQLTGRVEEAK
jgi:hypothetical protein